MGKQNWMSLLLAGTLLVTSAPPVHAADEASWRNQYREKLLNTFKRYSETADDDYGGLAPPPKSTPSNPGIPPEDENGGLAPSSSQSSDPKKRHNNEPTSKLAAGVVLAGVTLSTDSHNAYLNGSGGAFPSFYPTRQLLRYEAAVMLYRLLPDNTPVPNTPYADVPEDAAYANAVKTLAGLGVLEAVDGNLNPAGGITRGEFIRCIASFFPLRTDAELFEDVSEDDPNAPFIRSARAYGWTQGDSTGHFNPDTFINRGAAVSLLNRALGRSPDMAYIDLHHPAFYVDVSPSSWYYYDIIEATVGHQHSSGGEGENWTSHTARTEIPQTGLQLVNGWLYHYDSDKGDVTRNASVGSFTFNDNGHFTTGNAELDSYLHNIISSHTNAGQTQEQKLRSLFLYTRDSFTYLRRPPYDFGAHDFMETDALRILTTGYGNCYCYASLFWYLSRWIGYDSVIYSGTVGVRKSPHSWVEINMGGRNYIFDTELEMAYRRKGRYDVNLYKFYDAGNSWNYRRPKN